MSNFSNLVEDFYNKYHKKVKSNPRLYVSKEDWLNVTLPAGLLEYANSAAGHSGFGSGARAVGIRKKVVNSVEKRDEVFGSIESLENFILSSECNAAEYVESVRKRHLSGISKKKLIEIITDDRLIDTKGSRTTMSRRYGSDVFLKLGRKFGNKVVNNDIHTLTINEFELRYGLTQ